MGGAIGIIGFAVAMKVLSIVPLAQFVDVLPRWGWNVLVAAGMLAPMVGLIISLATKSMTSWKVTAIIIFYALSLPLAGLVILAQTDNVAGVCSFILLMPLGVILGLAFLAPAAQSRGPRGFEVKARRDDQAS